MSKTRDTIINAIASEEMLIETLEPRDRDALDFHEVSVRAVKAALERAYEAGRKAAPPTRVPCPACGREIEIRPVT